ncbi:hypothetical protein, partial [Xanthomonas phaseoli]
SARNGEIPKFQKPLFGTTPPSALSGLVVQTFPRRIATGQRSAWPTYTKLLHSYFESTQEIAATAHLPVSLLT